MYKIYTSYLYSLEFWIQNRKDVILYSVFCTVYLETTHGLDFKTPNFPRHVIYSRYCLDEENPYMQKNVYVLYWVSYAMFVEAAFIN